MTNQVTQTDKLSDSFKSLLDSTFLSRKNFEGKVVKGKVVAVISDSIIIDVGLKSEGRVSIKEFQGEVRVNDEIDVFVEKLEDRNGEALLSVEKARRETVWMNLEKACAEATTVNGMIFSRVKGGFAVDVEGAVAFLPGSQVDIRPIKDVTPLVNIIQPFIILKMDRVRNNIVVSRRAVLESTRAEARGELVSRLEEGQVIEGVVKNITDYGAFIDLGGIDGLLHVTDISWKRVNHPADVLTLGQTIKVSVLKFNKDTQRISLGMKQLEDDPWKDAESRFPVGTKLKGTVTNIADYGAFIYVAEGIEGLVYLTEMSWLKKGNFHPSKFLELGQEVEVVVLEVDSLKRRMSLGIKQCSENPWKVFGDQNPIGTIMEGVVQNVTEFGIFVKLTEDLDGMVHLSDVSWDSSEISKDALSDMYKKGESVKVKILDIDPNRERISLGIKQLEDDPFKNASSNFKEGSIVSGTVKHISDKGIEIDLGNNTVGFIRKGDLSRDKLSQRSDKFAVGEAIEAKVLTISIQDRQVILSIKAREMDEEKALMQEYSKEKGSAFGDVLASALDSKKV